MTCKYRLISIVAITLVIGAVAPCSAAEGKDGSVFDTLWSHATLYENQANNDIQSFALSGRLQTDHAWFDSDQGDFTDSFVWRRFRFGFKADLFRNWTLQIEGDFNLNDSIGDSYTRLTDAYIGWSPRDDLSFKFLKQSVGFTLDGATSSKKLLTMQRNNLTNNLWFTREYFTGISAEGQLSESWNYKAGVFSSDGSDELSRFDASYFTLLSLDYHINNVPQHGSGMLRIDYVYNDEDNDAATRDFSQVLSLVSQWELGSWGLRTDISTGKGYAGQSNLWGVVLMPYYNLTPRMQAVFRYTYISSTDDNGVRLSRYESEIVGGRGDEYNEFYAGLNVFLYGQKFMWQTGLDYASLKDRASDGGRYEGWGLSTGLRLYW